MEAEFKPTRSGKKRYAPPELIRHGDVDEITQRGGAGFIDVPIGAPIDGESS